MKLFLFRYQDSPTRTTLWCTRERGGCFLARRPAVSRGHLALESRVYAPLSLTAPIVQTSEADMYQPWKRCTKQIFWGDD